MDIPKTADEARKAGYETKTLSKDEASKLIKSALTNMFAAKVASKDCSTLPAGHLCWEGACDASGWKEVLYCDGTQGCTVYTKVRCS